MAPSRQSTRWKETQQVPNVRPAIFVQVPCLLTLSCIEVYRTPDLAKSTLAFIVTLLQLLLYAAHLFADPYVVRGVPAEARSDFALLVTTTLFWLVVTPSLLCESHFNWETHSDSDAMSAVICTCPVTHLGPLGPSFRYRRGLISRMRPDRYLRLVYARRSTAFKRV